MGDWCKYVGKEESVYIGSLVYSLAAKQYTTGSASGREKVECSVPL